MVQITSPSLATRNLFLLFIAAIIPGPRTFVLGLAANYSCAYTIPCGQSSIVNHSSDPPPRREMGLSALMRLADTACYMLYLDTLFVP